jgi:sporulation protein YlmC with PRC-barrel domain
MANIPLNAKVQCTDEACGKSTNLIVNPVNHKVTHLVVQDKSLPDNATRLVPVSKVAEVTQQQVRLNCSKADVAKLPPFIESNFVQETALGKAYVSDMGYDHVGEAAYTRGGVFTYPYVINNTAYDHIYNYEENIPEGELALHHGMHIEASDGKVGKLDMLVLAPDSGEITHLLLREGHLWGKKDVAVPVSEVKFCDAETIYLKLDKAAIQVLPAVPVKES